jgi:hypothetical protein
MKAEVLKRLPVPPELVKSEGKVADVVFSLVPIAFITGVVLVVDGALHLTWRRVSIVLRDDVF